MGYQGLFIRDYVGETPDNAKGPSWTQSPDICISGTVPLKDPQSLLDMDNYNKGLPDGDNQTPLQINFVYARGINTELVGITSTIYLYYVDTSIVLWPQNWKMDTIMHTEGTNVPINAAQVVAQAQGLAATIEPFKWTPPRQDNHYCLVAWVKNGDDQLEPPDLYSIGTVNDMANFILTHPNVGWKNTIEVDATQPTIENYATIYGAENGGLLNIGVQCQNLPTDGEIEFSVPGPDAQNTIIFPRQAIPNPNFAPTVQVRWPDNFDSTITFRYYKGKTDPPDGANIIPIVGTNGTGTDFIEHVKRVAPQYLADVNYYASPEEIITKGQGVPIKKIMIVGSVPFELKR
ncbi:hypothetical protein ACQKLP_08625 [Chitinophaga sp. NPDC101104]|uniref:hypothetical protein n=1 Tax=Chitinophaga sp. NPDC101104 TaxID=3390561 RepID=UPI003D08CD65